MVIAHGGVWCGICGSHYGRRVLGHPVFGMQGSAKQHGPNAGAWDGGQPEQLGVGLGRVGARLHRRAKRYMA